MWTARVCVPPMLMFISRVIIRKLHAAPPQQTCLRWANVGKRWHWSGRRRVTTLAQRRLAMSQDDANPTSGNDVGSTLFRRRLATSMDDAKSTSGDDVGSTLFRRRLATSQYDAKPTSGDDVGSTLYPRR